MLLLYLFARDSAGVARRFYRHGVRRPGICRARRNPHVDHGGLSNRVEAVAPHRPLGGRGNRCPTFSLILFLNRHLMHPSSPPRSSSSLSGPVRASEDGPFFDDRRCASTSDEKALEFRVKAGASPWWRCRATVGPSGCRTGGTRHEGLGAQGALSYRAPAGGFALPRIRLQPEGDRSP